MPVSNVVIDANVAVYALVENHHAASVVFERIEEGELEAAWPELALVEVANAAATLARVGRLSAKRAAELLQHVVAAPIRPESLSLLVLPALAIALKRSISAYDACYIVLAEALDVPLLTADRRLAAATPNGELI
jgi:predicted nucleic acid-binding protein